MKFRVPRGTADFLPGDVAKWKYLEDKARDLCRRYHFLEVRTPIFEYTELFQRGVGETTDIVEKEMYTFTDRAGRSLTLRPEGTAPVVRAFVENKVYAQPQPTKWFYIGPMFRYERPQTGRMRQFNQFGVEVFGARDPGLDAEIIALGRDYFEEIGLSGVTAEINSVGCPACRPVHREAAGGLSDAPAGEVVQGLSIPAGSKSPARVGLQERALPGDHRPGTQDYRFPVR